MDAVGDDCNEGPAIAVDHSFVEFFALVMKRKTVAAGLDSNESLINAIKQVRPGAVEVLRQLADTENSRI